MFFIKMFYDMGKRGPKANPAKEPNFVISFSAREDCKGTLELLRMATGKKKPRGEVISAALRLARAHPTEFVALLDSDKG